MEMGKDLSIKDKIYNERLSDLYRRCLTLGEDLKEMKLYLSIY